MRLSFRTETENGAPRIVPILEPGKLVNTTDKLEGVLWAEGRTDYSDDGGKIAILRLEVHVCPVK